MEFLQALDAKVTEPCRLPCFGGFAVTLAYGISWLTYDIDVLDVAPHRAVAALMREGGKGSPLAIGHKVHLDFCWYRQSALRIRIAASPDV